MGYVRVKALIGRSKDKAREVELLVDTGAFYTILPPSLAKKWGYSKIDPRTDISR